MRLRGKVKAQVQGRSLVPLLEHAGSTPAVAFASTSAWPERTLFTHLGRWAKGASPDTAKYRQCFVRTPRWHLVSPDGDTRPHWMLFEVSTDYGERTDRATEHPDVVRELEARFNSWWISVQPALVENERAKGPRINPFKQRFWKQFGAGPSPEDLKHMKLLP